MSIGAIAFMEELKHTQKGKYAQGWLDEVIEALKQTTWIPISERLPDKTGWYLITFKTYKNGVAVCESSYRKPENYWTGKDISKKAFDNNEILAWMPLPEPYKEESEE